MEQQQRNLFIAIAISIAILLGFQYFVEQPRREQQAHQQQTAQQHNGQQHTPQATQQTPAAKPGGTAAPATPAPGTAAPAAAQPQTREQVLAATPRVIVDAPRVHGSISLRGARIDDLTLAKYHETIDPKSPEIVLLAPAGTAQPYFAEFGWVPAKPGVRLPDENTVWTASSTKLTPKNPVTLTWDNGQGLRFTRTIRIDDHYMFTVSQTVENTGSEPVTLRPYGLISRGGTPPNNGSYLYLHEGPVGTFDNVTHEPSYGDLEEKPQVFDSTGGWLGFTDKYWLTSLVPDQQAPVKASFRNAKIKDANHYQADYLGPEKTVAPGGKLAMTDRLFAGAKVVEVLEHYRDEYNISRFDYAVDWGYLWFLTKPIFQILDFFHGLLGNFGLAILLLTVMVKLLFFPLANKSYAAMSRMKQLQPRMMELRERFGDDKQRLNQEMMQLYKQAGANPLAGCLPIVIQIPVFFALYKVLFTTIEMRHAPFYGWIHDLSAPDPTSVFNLFGLIPWDPPSALMIGAWPIIMGCTMFLQQRLNPQPADPVQARMFMFLPIVFTYMLSHFAAGLVIYWAWNNTLSVAQQWVIMRRNGVTPGRRATAKAVARSG